MGASESCGVQERCQYSFIIVSLACLQVSMLDDQCNQKEDVNLPTGNAKQNKLAQQISTAYCTSEELMCSRYDIMHAKHMIWRIYLC
jgi:hypothetical protein